MEHLYASPFECIAGRLWLRLRPPALRTTGDQVIVAARLRVALQVSFVNAGLQL
ncbi:hypothetical protein [Pseudoxanthomonas sp. UTMC 1351]|uniref:hypothetical protein n=1 Tax=Pseudoxanthomonas sp. UTMC 1351 TaxID=2695853 RepID=UPI0034CE1DA2